MPKGQTKRIFCNNCRTLTNHECVGEHLKKEEYKVDDQGPEHVEMDVTVYRLWICAGCEHGTMEQINGYELFNETELEDEGEIVTREFYPERTVRLIQTKQFKHISKKLATIYRETLHAYNVGANLLCAIGIRTLIEGIAANKGYKGKDLRERIDKMEGTLPSNIVTGIHKLRFIGNIAAHELNSPEESELELAIEICEDLMNFFYELEYKAKTLKKPRWRQKERNDVHLNSTIKIEPKSES